MLFNPVVPNWTKVVQQEEDRIKQSSLYNLYYLADPKQDDNHLSFYSLSEAIAGDYDDLGRTIIVLDDSDMPEHAKKSMLKTYQDLKARFPQAHIFETLAEAEEWLAARLRQH